MVVAKQIKLQFIAANPSMLSIKFIEFIRVITQKIVKTKLARPPKSIPINISKFIF